MSYKLNLRSKILLAYIGYSLLLSSLTVVGVILATQMSETRSQRDRIKVEAEYYLSDYLSSFIAPASNSFNSARSTSPFITYYYGEELLPLWVKNKVLGLQPGTYFRDNDKQKYCILIKRLPDGENFYLLYNVTRQNRGAEALHSLQMTILLTLLPILIFGVTLGLITSHKVIGPVLRLEKFMRKLEPRQKLPDDFEKVFNKDEIGFLAATLKTSVNDMQDSIERETSFARDASHELRTPITTIKNSLELLDEMKPNLTVSTQKVLRRMSRATSNMEHLVKSFLWLSRQNRLHEFKSTSVNVYDLVEEVVQEQNFIIEQKPVVVKVFDEGSVKVNTEPQLMKILIANLIRNAFTYTERGFVEIHIKTTCFQVRDSGRGIKPDGLMMIKDGTRKGHADGFGLGLSIVKKLCANLGWSFYICSEVGKGTQTRICYNLKERCDWCIGLNMKTPEETGEASELRHA
ncbi:sensor histidine kinase [Deferribacteres bacterium DY0037]